MSKPDGRTISGRTTKLGPVVLAAVLALVLFGFWLSPADHGPRYQGRTAREWYRGFLRREGNHAAFVAALRELNTNFVPVLTTELRKSSTWFEIEYFQRFQSLPQSVKRFLRAPRSPFERQDNAFQTLVNLVNSDSGVASTLSKDLPLFESFLKTSQESRALFLIYASSTGDGKLMEKLRHLGHTNFWTRFAAAVYLQDFELRHTSDPRGFSNAIPVCLEAITNASALARKDGINTTNLQNRALGLLRVISPEMAAQYSGSGR